MQLKPSFFAPFNEWVAKHYGRDTGKMLVHTGVVGWLLSAAAQVMAIVVNDKIPKEQKLYLVPQELADAAVNILSFYTITQGCKSITSKLVSTGKLLPKSIRQVIDAKGLTNRIGKIDFNVLKDANLTKEELDVTESFKNGIDVIGATIGSVVSCNLVTPIIRNEIAASRQKKLIGRMNSGDEHSTAYQPANYPYTRPTFESFIHSGTLKI
ncbi:MAG: hypothetical protein NC191_03935 [Muribaculaceae bacterium]|nr:hypothetical protein [Muribaculaceae bacterium]